MSDYTITTLTDSVINVSVTDELTQVIATPAIQGQRGPQGIQGPAGPAGADGISANVDEIKYSNINLMQTDVGHIPAGTSFDNQSLRNMFDQLLYGTPAITFGRFYSGYDINKPELIGFQDFEVGYTIPNPAGFFIEYSNGVAIKPNSCGFYDVTNNTTVADNLTFLGDMYEGAFSVGTITYDHATAHRFKVQASDEFNHTYVKTSDVNFCWRVYWGGSSNGAITEAEIKSFWNHPLITAEKLWKYALPSSWAGGVYMSFNDTITDSGLYRYVCYPSSMPLVYSFIDFSTGLQIPMIPVSTINITNEYGQVIPYNVHRTVNQFFTGIMTIEIRW